jgi:hypothetical protein
LQPVTSFARGFDPGFSVFLYCHIEYGKTKWPGSSKICFMNPHLPSDGVWFPNWAVVLAKVRLKDLDRRAYRLAIVGYLTFCKRARQRATVTSARLFMAEMESQRRLSRSQLTVWKAALNWFFTAAPATPSGEAPSGGALAAKSQADPLAKPCARGKEPPLAATDLGGPEWERELIRVLRERHYEWRTEQAYRMWARRFAGWLEGRGVTVSGAGELEMRGFLSELAVRQRVAVATQRQAFHPVR